MVPGILAEPLSLERSLGVLLRAPIFRPVGLFRAKATETLFSAVQGAHLILAREPVLCSGTSRGVAAAWPSEAPEQPGRMVTRRSGVLGRAAPEHTWGGGGGPNGAALTRVDIPWFVRSGLGSGGRPALGPFP